MTDTHPTRIGLDGYNLALPHGTGVATYGRVLGETLAGMGHPLDGLFGLDVSRTAPPGLREVLFFEALSRGPAPPPKPTLRRLARRSFTSPLPRRAIETLVGGVVVTQDRAGRLPPFDRIFNSAGLFTIAARHFRRYRRFMTVKIPAAPAIMHWTYPLPIRLAGARNIYTIHDLVPLRLPHASTEDKAYHHRLIRACLAQAAHVCTVSEASRQDILDIFPETAAGRVTNTYQAVPAESEMAPGELAARLRNLFDLSPRGYLLFFGALEPKKNIGRLLEAYLTAGIEMPLVIVGAGGWRNEDELRLLTGAHGSTLAGLSRIRRLDYLPRPLLGTLVRGARAVLFPSLYEGFGLPMVEAMALGAPVLTSTTSSLPEIAGGAALLVDPYDVQAMAAALVRLAGDDALCAELGRAGLARARRFSMDAYAVRLRDLYGKVLRVEPQGRTAPQAEAAEASTLVEVL
jgi:glycosyltransferase involved in cell wall biosynthesis